MPTRSAPPRGPEATGTSKQSRERFFMPLRGGSSFPGAARNKNKTQGRGGPLRVGIAAFTCPTHGPIPPPTHRRPLLGSLRVGWPLQGRGLPRGNHNGPKEAIASTRHKKSALPRPRPVGHQSTPWPHQTPTKHPRGPAHHPARLWWPWAMMGGLWGCQKSENRPAMIFMPRLGVTRALIGRET